jgi:hypothetical protein
MGASAELARFIATSAPRLANDPAGGSCSGADEVIRSRDACG